MYALIISTNRRNKDQEKTKKQTQRNKKPGAKNHKTQNTKKSQKEERPEVLSWRGHHTIV